MTKPNDAERFLFMLVHPYYRCLPGCCGWALCDTRQPFRIVQGGFRNRNSAIDAAIKKFHNA